MRPMSFPFSLRNPIGFVLHVMRPGWFEVRLGNLQAKTNKPLILPLGDSSDLSGKLGKVSPTLHETKLSRDIHVRVTRTHTRSSLRRKCFHCFSFFKTGLRSRGTT